MVPIGASTTSVKSTKTSLDNHGIDPDDVNLLRANGAPDHGSNTTYHRMVKRFDSETCPQMSLGMGELRMDIQNFIDYQFFQIFFKQRHENIVLARIGPDSRWRWICTMTIGVSRPHPQNAAICRQPRRHRCQQSLFHSDMDCTKTKSKV